MLIMHVSEPVRACIRVCVFSRTGDLEIGGYKLPIILNLRKQ